MWRDVSDAYTVTAGESLRLAIGGGYVELGTDEAKIKSYLERFAPVYVTRVSHVLFWGWNVDVVAARSLAVGEVRAGAANAINSMRDEWFVVGPGMQLFAIQIEEQDWIPEVPTTTAISLAAIAILVIAGFVLVRTYVR